LSIYKTHDDVSKPCFKAWRHNSKMLRLDVVHSDAVLKTAQAS